VEVGKRDPVTGRLTTGHEWNGIEELDTPVPRVVLFFLAVGITFAVIYWLLMPAWPLGTTYTKGLLGINQRQIVAKQIEAAEAERSAWMERVGAEDFAAIEADNELMTHVRDMGRALFADNCAACHGVKATGGKGFPNLTAKAWLWGGDPETIAETIRVGINSTNDDTRTSQMMAFGHDGTLDRTQVRNVVAYVRSLSAVGGDEAANPDEIKAGQEVFATTCVPCHGEDAKGKVDVGAPNLTDANWLYGGDAQSVYTTVYSGRQGHMPHWSGRLSPTEIKILALYVHSMGTLTP
jgi:cytochrome c oxidase cbb3-type subunit 3